MIEKFKHFENFKPVTPLYGPKIFFVVFWRAACVVQWLMCRQIMRLTVCGFDSLPWHLKKNGVEKLTSAFGEDANIQTIEKNNQHFSKKQQKIN